MLSYNFSSDEEVLRLDVYHALALAFMVARADNLGRLPGEPGVLLYYLFEPKPPRPDFSVALVEETIVALVRAKIVRWFVVEGVRYVQLVRWSGHQNIRQDLRKSDLPDPDSGCDVVLSPEPEREPPKPGRDKVAPKSRLRSDKVAREVEVEVEVEVEDKGAALTSPRDNREAIRDLVHRTADSARVEPRPAPPKLVPSMTEALDPAWKWVQGNVAKDGQRAAMAFAAWLYKSGSLDADAILALVKHRVVHAPRNEHAYYANTGDARDAIVTRVLSDRAIAEHERIKREEREFLDRKGA